MISFALVPSVTKIIRTRMGGYLDKWIFLLLHMYRKIDERFLNLEELKKSSANFTDEILEGPKFLHHQSGKKLMHSMSNNS